MKQLLLFALVNFSLFIPYAFAQDTTAVKGAPVVFEKDTLFYIYSKIGPFTPEERAEAVQNRIKKITREPDFQADSIKIKDSQGTTDIIYGDWVVISLTDDDALAHKRLRDEMAVEYQQILKYALQNHVVVRGWKNLLIDVGLLILALAGLVLILYFLNRAFRWVSSKTEKVHISRLFPDSKLVQVFKFITPERERQFWQFTLRMMRVATILILLFFYLPFLFSFLPWTRGLAEEIYDYILSPVKFVLTSMLDFLPNVFFILVILVVTHYVVRFLKYLAHEVERERLVFTGFYPEWAMPTFTIVRLMIYVFALVVIFPYLPGSDSPAFKGISIFFGVLFSLGSTSAVANIVAGIVITYMRPFQIGDRVKIGETVGDVVEKTFLVTRIRTIKNEGITIPNSEILGNHMINYTNNAQDMGLVLHTSVTIGYDVPWKTVQQLLVSAANLSKNIEDDPKPFVLHKKLDDFYIEYELNAITREPKYMAFTYSELHKNILKCFNEAGVEIMSPHYRAMRDGNASTIPNESMTDDDPMRRR